MSTITVTLEGNDYTIRPLTLGQIEELRIAILEPPGNDVRETVRHDHARIYGILAAALRADYPEMTIDAIRYCRASFAEVRTAMDRILIHSGLAIAGAESIAASGEAKTATAS
jgi:hypothetical protein